MAFSNIAPVDVLTPFFNTPQWLAWTHNLLLIGLLTLFGVTALYMVGYALNMSAMKTWAKGEYMQVIVTFLLAFAIMHATAAIWSMMVDSVSFFYTSTNPAMANLAPNVKYDPFAFSQAYIDEVYIGCEKTIYQVLYPINYYYKFAGKTFTEPLGVEKLGGWSTSVYTNFMDYIAGNLNNLLLMQYIQVRFLSLVKYVMPLLIEIGLVLRAFPPSRGTGGLLIAFGFGFFLVYPISLALLTTLQAPPGSTFCTSFQAPELLSLERFCGTSSAEQKQAQEAVLASSNQTAGLLEQIKTFLASFYLQAVFFPLVALTVTWSFSREFSELLSGDLSEIGRGLIKLI